LFDPCPVGGAAHRAARGFGPGPGLSEWRVAMAEPKDLTVIVPALNESGALPELIGELHAALGPLALEYGILVVDDGSTDGTFELVQEMAATDPRLGAVRLRRNFGKSAALAVGFDSTSSDLVITIDGDGQDDPADIPKLLDRIDEGADLVSGWKRDRQDPWTRRLASKVFNAFTSLLTGVRMHDMNCGFKAYRGECARSLEVYGELHRFLPVLAEQQGWVVAEVPVNHRPRVHGRSRFGLERYLRGALDLMTVSFLGRYQNRPLHLFGGLGVLFSVAGIAIGVYLTIIKVGGQAIGERPLLFLGVLLIVVGVQLFSLGLLAQILVVNRREAAGAVAEQALVAAVTGRVPAAEPAEARAIPAPPA
jgi:glycosyltransferase involved in cell wall biosynthesis